MSERSQSPGRKFSAQDIIPVGLASDGFGRRPLRRKPNRSRPVLDRDPDGLPPAREAGHEAAGWGDWHRCRNQPSNARPTPVVPLI